MALVATETDPPPRGIFSMSSGHLLRQAPAREQITTPAQSGHTKSVPDEDAPAQEAERRSAAKHVEQTAAEWTPLSSGVVNKRM
jgi:hypothetical protein